MADRSLLISHAAAFFPRSCLTMSARISDTVCRCRTAALFAIIIQMSFLSVDIGKSIPSVIAAANNTELHFKRPVHYVAGETIMSRRHLAIGKRQRSQSLVPLRGGTSREREWPDRTISTRKKKDKPAF